MDSAKRIWLNEYKGRYLNDVKTQAVLPDQYQPDCGAGDGEAVEAIVH